MNRITTEQVFPLLPSGGPDKAPTDNYDSSLKVFEEMVDRIVSKKLKDSKAEKQAAIEKAKIEAEQQRKMAFLMGAVHQAEAALAGTPSPSRPLDPQSPQAPGPLSERDHKEDQLIYWKAKLIQAGIPDGTTGPF